MDLKAIGDFLKTLGPAYATLVVFFGGLGYFMSDLYKFNVTNKVEHAFPSQNALFMYFIFALFAAVLILLVVTFQTFLNKDTSSSSARNVTP